MVADSNHPPPVTPWKNRYILHYSKNKVLHALGLGVGLMILALGLDWFDVLERGKYWMMGAAVVVVVLSILILLAKHSHELENRDITLLHQFQQKIDALPQKLRDSIAANRLTDVEQFRGYLGDWRGHLFSFRRNICTNDAALIYPDRYGVLVEHQWLTTQIAAFLGVHFDLHVMQEFKNASVVELAEGIKVSDGLKEFFPQMSKTTIEAMPALQFPHFLLVKAIERQMEYLEKIGYRLRDSYLFVRRPEDIKKTYLKHSIVASRLEALQAKTDGATLPDQEVLPPVSAPLAESDGETSSEQENA